MSFGEQTTRRKHAIFKQALRFNEAAANVVIQRVPVRELRRLMKTTDSVGDPVVEALINLDAIFTGCKDKNVDMASSIDELLAEHEESRQYAAVLLAWRVEYDGAMRRVARPELVGIATLSDFLQTPRFSTDEASMSRRDMETLRPFFGARFLYIDAMCSVHPGVGRLLVLHAFAQALKQRKEGLVALAFSSRSKAVPESRRIFRALGFETLIETANFKVRLYGSWHLKRCSNVDLAGLVEKGVDVCTRHGLTPSTSHSLIWRCPT